MSTFIGQLVGFSLIVFLGWRYVAPLIRRLMANQQHAIRTQLDDSAAAKQQLAEAENAHQAAVERAGAEAKRVTEEARADAERIGEQLREQADFEVERIKVQGAQQVQLLRAQLIRQMQHDLGAESLNRAGELVRDHVSDPGAQSATVDRLLDEVEAMAPSPTVIEDPAMAQLRSASRDALSALVTRFDAVSADLDEDGLTTLADELASVARLLHREPILTRHLADSSGNSAAKDALLERVLSGQVGAATLEVLKGAVSGRWSEDADLIHAVEHVAQLSLLVRAERAGQAGEVEEQLFRFGRLLDAQPRLAKLLSSYTQPVEGRLELLRNVLSSSTAVNPTTAELLSQTVNLLRGERAEDAVRELAQLAVARRGEVVAHVEAAVDLTDAQRTRLTEILARIYGHPVSVQLQIKPELLGGLNITVGDEVIDGTLSSKLAAAETQLLD